MVLGRLLSFWEGSFAGATLVLGRVTWEPENGVFPKMVVFPPKMDGENNGKPYFLMDDLGEKTHYFRKHPNDGF